MHAPSNASNRNKNGEKAARHKQEIRKDNNKENLSSNQWPSRYWMTHSAPELQPPTGVECGPTAHLCPGAASLFNLASVFLLSLEERVWISLPPLPLYENDLHHTVTGAASVLRHRHCNRKMKVITFSYSFHSWIPALHTVYVGIPNHLYYLREILHNCPI